MSSRSFYSRIHPFLVALAVLIALFLWASARNGDKADYSFLVMPTIPIEVMAIAIIMFLLGLFGIPYLRRNGLMGLVPLTIIGALAWFLLSH